MKNLFKRKGSVPKTPKLAFPNADNKFPFSQPGNQRNKDERHESPENKKTRIGLQSDVPIGSNSRIDNLSCPNCQYPLRIEPSRSSPCPNCGYVGSAGLHDTVSDSKKTISISNLNFKDEPELSSFRFKMISESSGSEFKIESEENELVLNRDHLDPNNTSISSKEHVIVKFRNGKIFFLDVSTNGSTFIQVIDKMLVTPGTRIVLGNRIFLFSQGQSVQDSGSRLATRQISNVNLDNKNVNEIVLVEENSGRKIQLTTGVNVLNRNNLDPGNPAISGNRHALLEFNNGEWYLSDLSSNSATFVQCKTEQQITDKTKIIIGDLIFRFEYY